MTTSSKFPLLACCVSIIVCFAGCSSSSSNAPITVAVSPQAAYVGSGQTLQFTAAVTNDTSGVTWSTSGSAAGTVDAQGNFTAPAVTQNSTATVTATSVKDPSVSSSASVTIIAPGTVTTTANAQVALYTITVPDGLSAFIQFSTDTSYGLKTWSVAAPSGGGAVPIFVAGMIGNTEYHMRAVFQTTGTTDTVFTDVDHTFTTSAYDAAILPALAASTASGQVPQPGVELLSLINTSTAKLAAVATDLSGNVIWAYDPGSSIPAGSNTNPIKPLPNGHFLIVYTVGPGGTVTDSVIQEVDLSGQIIWELTPTQLNAKLAAASCAGCNITVIGNHHDVAILPNGHLILLGSVRQTLTVPNFSPNPVSVLGDVLIDLDENRNPVWVWNSFDWLDVNRHPMLFPDWTHSNAVVYSPDDKALMLSIRHQAWVIKINYNDGSGDGSILWKLGYQGDFALQSGTTNAVDPVDWFNAQHDPTFVSTTTAGMLDVLLFDNGNQRVLDSGGTLCGPTTTPCDSRVPILHLDEGAKTADIIWVDKLAPVFSNFGGSARQLSNGNIEFDECSTSFVPPHAAIFEVTKTTPAQVVWQMQVTGQFAYRAIRIPSLYPGVQW